MAQYQSRNALDTNAKSTAIAILNARLADTIDLALITKQAHWNLKGKNFYSVHKMLDEVRDDVDEYVDDMAERITALGGVAVGTAQAVAERTGLPSYPTDLQLAEDHVRALVERFAAVANEVRGNIGEVDEAGDPDTADVLTSVSRGLDKWLWMLEAHLHG